MLDLGELRVSKMIQFVKRYKGKVDILPEDNATYRTRRHCSIASRCAKFGLRLCRDNVLLKIYTTGGAHISFRSVNKAEEFIDFFDFLLTASPIKVKEEDEKTYVVAKHKEYGECLAKYGLRYNVPSEGGPRVIYTDDVDGFKLLLSTNKTVKLFIEFLEEFNNTFKGGIKNAITEKT